jgi:hypothetical protein
MKRMAIIMAGFLALIIFVMKSDADIRINPSEITSPNEAGEIHLTGNVSTGSYSKIPSGAVISAINNYEAGLNYSYGGWFEATSPNGFGVYCKAAGSAGDALYGIAIGQSGTGVYGRADGSNGRAVVGYASNTENVTNYGGFFEAKGTSGRGVYGKAPKYGGYFTVDGYQGRAVYATATASNSIGVYGKATGANSTGVWGEGVNYDFYANGPGTNYGSFTGAHDVKFAKDMAEDILPGLITSVTGRTELREGKNGSISLSSTLPTVTISKKANDKKVFGVIVSNSPLPQDHWYKVEDGERFGIVNAVGEGRVWVTNLNGNIEAGDYITTSGISGHGMLQDDDLLHSYTLGKAIETIDWDQVAETVQHDRKTYKRYLIAIVYTSG